MKAIQVFCGSSSGFSERYTQQAIRLGQLLASSNIDLVYGGGNVGLMGALADAALEAGGTVIGVIPHFLMEKEVGHHGLSQLVLVDSMHERKIKMAELSQGTIVLPGGYGTLDELFEILTLVQLGVSNQAIGILNVNGFYDYLIRHLDTVHQQGFLRDFHRSLLLVADTAEDLLQQMREFTPPKPQGKWWKVKP